MSGDNEDVKRDVEIRLLGTPGIEVSGRPVTTDTRKATALLAYLAVTGRPASRDRLSDLLWPEVGQKKGRASLRRTLSALGEARSGGWLLVDRENISLAPERILTDAVRFRELLGGDPNSRDIEALSGAVALYRDDFMAGFTLRDSAVFDDWQFFEGESLRQLLAGALDELSGMELRAGRYEEATSHARRWLALDRLHEPAHRRLMQAYADSGRRSAALKQYAGCRRILHDELGVEPQDETRKLYEDMKSGSYEPEKQATSGDTCEPEFSESGAGRARLFGRDSEWEVLAGSYAEPGSVVVAIEGEAGIGKTKLAERFVACAAQRGSRTMTTRCYSGESSLAYGPFIALLSGISENPRLSERLHTIPDNRLGEARRLHPELGGGRNAGWVPSDGPGAQSRLFEGVSQTLLGVLEGDHRGEPSGVILIDDAHLADSSSLGLLYYLVRRATLTRRNVKVILTWRGEDLASDHPLRRLAAESRRSGSFALVALERLDRGTVEEMASAAGHTGDFGRRLYDETEGLPLLLAEYLEAASGDPDGREESWPAPGGVRDLFSERISSVSRASLPVLGAAAVIGRSFDFDLVWKTGERGEDETLDALEELTSRGLIAESGEGREPSYDFSHGKLREAVYEGISPARRRVLHRRVAESLQCSGDDSGSEASRVAHHLRMAGKGSEAARYFALAGEHDRSVYANVEALSHFRAALRLGHPDVASLGESVGDLLTLTGDYEAARKSFEKAATLTDYGEDLARLGRKLGDVYQRQGAWAKAEGHYVEALRVLGEGASAGIRARLYSDLSLLSHRRGDPAAATEQSGIAQELAAESEDPLTLARTHSVAAVVARGRGDPTSAKEHLVRSLEASEEAGDFPVRVSALNNLSLVLFESGDAEAAIEPALEALELCERLGDRHREAALNNNLADLYHAVGREEESRERLRRAVEVFAEIGDSDELLPEIWKLSEW